MSMLKYTSKCYCNNNLIYSRYCYFCLAACCDKCSNKKTKEKQLLYGRLICAACVIQDIDFGFYCCLLCDQIKPVGIIGVLGVNIHKTSFKHICEVCVSTYDLQNKIKIIYDEKHVYAVLTDIRLKYIKNIEISSLFSFAS